MIRGRKKKETAGKWMEKKQQKERCCPLGKAGTGKTALTPGYLQNTNGNNAKKMEVILL